ncbi:uncharacterized protein LOC116345413 [Contarinia nasturtii]|uniref:uncharacterized protein LOC116345413 n=1 Tax=Contarinia nasturtii TaxID=265458 RepID=UPI0012D47DA1|nr:uncharacterized protein LOC116345413 [Contarinia nasturtii]
METSTSETDFARNIVCTDTQTENFEIYRSFLEYFAENVDPTDQLPVRVPNYTLEENEISGAVIDWMIQYLGDKKCPQTLVAPIIKLALDQTHQTLRKSPEQYGYLANTNEYQTLKLMQLSISKINDVCQSLLDNLQLDKLIPSPPVKRPALYSAKGIKNTRRHMEDRHIIIDDFNQVFGIKDSDTTSYYAIFDGHGGTDAAAYSVSHLHCEIVASKFYPSKPHEALREAFLNTDEKFIEKSKKQKLMSGTTALCALYRPTERQLVVGWVGDSKALLVSQNRVLQIVNPHKPDTESERIRIEKSGGCVLEFPPGCYRVNGRLAVSRAIGDYGLKDVVIGEPDIAAIPLNGKEDFLILACDGLWDYAEEDEVATKVYNSLEKNDGDVQPIAGQLIELAKKNSSSDNISVIVVFLKDPHQIIAEHKLVKATQEVTRMDFESTNGCHHLVDDGLLASNPSAMHETASSPDKMHVDFNKATVDVHHDAMDVNDFYFGKNGSGIDANAVDDVNEYHSNIQTIPSTIKSNGDADKFSSNEINVGRSIDDDHDDFGPETDVDATDDNAISPMSPSGYDYIERVGDGIATTDEHQVDISETLVKKPEENDNNIQHSFDDNRFVDHVNEHFVNAAAANHFEQQNEHFEDDEPELPNKIDFAEKKDYNEEDFDDDDDDDDDVHDEVLNASMPENLHHMPDVITTECEQHVLPTNNSVPIENVVVAESGEDSDDEWNYIKVDKEKQPEQENKTPIELEIEQPEEAASSEQHQEEAVEEDITSPTPPTASIGETDFVNQQSHAIAQAFAEPEEVCTELLEEKQETEHPELFELDRAERSSSVAAEHDSDLGNEQDLEEEMDSQLNPNAEEFVPVSPQRTSVSSPFGNGLTNRFDLDDEVVSQSPRKGTAILMNDNDIVLPAENDFTEISQRPSELTANELNFDNIQCDNENVVTVTTTVADAVTNDTNLITTADVDELKDVKRPESSSSQCSYQEMNLKEAMHGDEKQELAAEDPDTLFAGGDVPTTNGGGQQFSERDPMNMSFYNDENNPFKEQQEVDMNAVQPLPDDMDDDVSQENELVDYVSKPVVSNNHLLNDMQGEMEELVKEFSSEGEKLNINSEQLQQPTPITNLVQELATECKSILLEDNEDIKQNVPNSYYAEHDTELMGATPVDLDEINRNRAIECDSSVKDMFTFSESSLNAHEFIPSAPVSDMDIDPVRSAGVVESELNILSEDRHEFMQYEQPFIVSDEPSVEEIVAPIEQPIEPEPQSQPEQPEHPIVESTVNEPIVAAAAVVATTAAVAAAAVGVAKAASPKTKTTETKKPEVKSKLTATKKPTTTTTAPRVAASKLAAKPSTTTVPKTTVTSKVASRTVAPKVGTTTVEKKTTTSTITRKPLSNGSGITSTSSVAKKTTTLSTATKSATGTTRTSGTTLKPATARTSSATTTATKTSLSKPAGTSTTAAPRVPLSARTVSKPASSATSKVTATKTTTVSSTTRVKSAPVSTTARSTTLTKPKTSLTADKPSVTKSTVTKVSPTKTSTLTAAKSPAARSSLLSASKTTPTRKPLSTQSKTPITKSPRVPTTNGVASKTKVVAKSAVGAAATAAVAGIAVGKEKQVTTNGNSNLNGHIEENGTGAEKIIDVSAD